jgi:hypothetical protein
VSSPTESDLLTWTEQLCNWGRWGADDQLGTLNLVTPEVTRAAAGLIELGEAVSCAQPWQFATSGPLTGSPSEEQARLPEYRLLPVSEDGPPGPMESAKGFAAEYVGAVFHAMPITHLDALSHASWEGRMYNGVPEATVSSDAGAQRLGVGSAACGVASRGILIDAPYLRGVPVIEPHDGIGLADLELAARRCGVEPRPGDVVLLRAGAHHRLSGPRPEVLPSMRAADVAVLGSDTGNDVRPSGYERFSHPVHQIGLVHMGLWLLDVAALDQLAATCRRLGRWEFFLGLNPLSIPNATGSPVNPIAIF